MHPDPDDNALSWRHPDEADLARVRRIDLAPQHGEIVVIDLAEANQQELERRVAAGEALPEGFTPESVAEWRAEHPAAPIAVVHAPPGAALEYADPVLIPFDTEAVAAEVGVDDRCTSACGQPADPDVESRAKTACPVHPDGAHRCYRRPRHQYGQADETGGRLSAADHECDCGAIWLCLVGGMTAFRHQMDTTGDARRNDVIRLVHAGINLLQRHRGLTGRVVVDLEDVRGVLADAARTLGVKIDGE